MIEATGRTNGHVSWNGAGPSRHARILIVGSGFAGLGMAIRLKKAGYHDFVIFERAYDVGGTWRDNTYPGCACDVPSHLYSFSFEPNPDWSTSFSPQSEIWDYLRRCAEKYDITPHIRFGHEMVEAAWDDEARLWRLETSQGRYSGEILVSAVGGLSEPKLPDVPGIDTFEGALFHSAQWNHEHDLTGERVAAVGTGASAIQFVPAIQPKVGKLYVFQRTPPWIVPRRDRRYTSLERRLFRAFPPLQLAIRAGIYWVRELYLLGFRHRSIGRITERLALKHLSEQVPDPELRAKLRPSYRMGCKRILISNDWYPALQQPNVELVTEAVTEIKPRSVVAADGTEREVDTIIFGTGFHVTDMPVMNRVRGAGGVLLADLWQESLQAYKGTTIAGFPNLFFLVGPNTGLGHNSIVYMIESQLNYVIDALRFMDRNGVAVVDVREDAQARYNEEVQRQMAGTVWTEGGCASWYLDAKGRNTTLWPLFTFQFREQLRRFDPECYVLRARSERLEPVAA
ncbi:MAG: NAD(P)/FAD-dependent oxidoreductase [Thermoleophilaceae bacterium]|nr:NAD(P)/FAD-dependent oxidoreductase [Thermoleophilaceae bacterium]